MVRASNTKGKIMNFNKLTIVASAAALSLGVAACDSPAEEAAEDQADAMEDAGEITDEEADAMEAQADDIEDAAEGDTDAMTEDLEEAVN